MTWQPEPGQRSPDGSASDDGPGLPGDQRQESRRTGRRRGRGRLAAFTVLLATGLAGLALCAVGISHQLLPRQFTVAQRRQISAWEVGRRWRAFPAGKIFPDSVAYVLPAQWINANGGLTLDARLLSVSPLTSCAAAFSPAAASVLSQHGCSAALRATYVDSSGSLVATVAVAILPGSAAARTVMQDLAVSGRVSASLVQPLSVAGTPATGFGDAQRQLTRATGAGPYVILSTVGFADGRHRLRLTTDPYLEHEVETLASGLAGSVGSVLGERPPTPACPGAPGC